MYLEHARHSLMRSAQSICVTSWLKTRSLVATSLSDNLSNKQPVLFTSHYANPISNNYATLTVSHALPLNKL